MNISTCGGAMSAQATKVGLVNKITIEHMIFMSDIIRTIVTIDRRPVHPGKDERRSHFLSP